MTDQTPPKRYDLEERTLLFARRIVDYVNKLPRTVSNHEIGEQLVRAGTAVGANYIEANEALGKKDCAMRMRISRKEGKESRYWLNLSQPIPDREGEKQSLIQEATELMNILSDILRKIA